MNEVRISGDPDDMDKLRTWLDIPIDGEDGECSDVIFDYNKILPIPEGLDKYCSPTKIVSQEEYDKAKEADDNVCGLPMTQEIHDELLERAGTTSWYSWCINNWGCKWNAGDVFTAENSDEVLEIHYDSPWDPPKGIYGAIIDKIDDEGWDIHVSWFYHEPGMEFAGYLPD